MHHLPFSYWLAQLWLRYIRRCDVWRYRLTFDDAAHQGEEKHVFEGHLWALDEAHALQLQETLNLHFRAHLHHQAYASQSENTWMGLRFDPTSKRGARFLTMAAGVRNVRSNMRKGWSPGGLKPGLLLNMVYRDLSQTLDRKIEHAQQQKTNEQIITAMTLTLLLCMFLSLGSIAVIIVSAVNHLNLSWGLVYAAIFVSVTFGMMSYGLIVRLREMLNTTGAKHDPRK